MSAPDYPMTVARDRFGVWLHVTGLSFREVVEALPERFAAGALLVFDAEQLDYTTSALLEHRREQGRTRDQLLADLADLDDNAFWSRHQPIFENPSATVWPAECLDEMVLAQGPAGGCFGVCPIDTETARGLAPDFVYEHPSNVAAQFAFYSVSDSATSVFLTSEDDLLLLVRHVLGKALGADPEHAEGIDDIARALRPRLEEGGVDVRSERREGEAPPSATAGLPGPGPAPPSEPLAATVALGLWPLRSQWPLLWRQVSTARIAWDGRRWQLSEPEQVPGRAYLSPVRLLGELFHATGWLTSYLVVFGFPIVAAVLIAVFSGWFPGLIALVVAVLLWPKFVLRANWRDLRKRKAIREEHAKKYGL
jgi:hypothetical protein